MAVLDQQLADDTDVLCSTTPTAASTTTASEQREKPTPRAVQRGALVRLRSKGFLVGSEPHRSHELPNVCGSEIKSAINDNTTSAPFPASERNAPSTAIRRARRSRSLHELVYDFVGELGARPVRDEPLHIYRHRRPPVRYVAIG
jgi:hypothetical protein